MPISTRWAESSMAGKRALVALLLGWLVVLAAARPALASVTIAPSRDYIVDTAQVVTPETRRQLDGWLQELQEKTGAQIKLLTVRTTAGEDFFDFCQRHYQAWQLGRKGKDDGALIVMAVDDHKVRIHTGYGLEGALPDSWCGTASRQAATDYFKTGQIDAGLKWLVVAVVHKMADDRNVQVAGLPELRHAPGNADTANNVLGLVIVLVILAIYFWSIYQRRRQQPGWSRWLGGPWIPGSTGGFGSYGGSSFGGGSSGGGSFGGGSFGGGSFGGGGSSGGGGGGASW
jgi:uncharacterized protein